MRPALAALVSLFVSGTAVVPCGGSEAELQRLDDSTVRVSEVERAIPELMAKVWLPGMSVVVVRDNAIAYRQSFGVRDVRTGEPITDRTSFTGLSFSKTITAYLTMRLVERGVIDLDRPLHTYLSKPVPEYAFYADLAADARYKQITARHVLSHTTGWPNWRWFTEERKLSFLFDPGERHSYSGEGFAYLQLALEETTGKTFARLARDEVFDPLDMSRSSMVWEAEFEDDYAEDHDLLGRPIGRQRRDEASAAGSLQTTIGDYTRFLIAVLTSQGLSPGTRDRMLESQVDIRHARMFGPRLFEEVADPRELSWTLGWGRTATPYGWAFFHTGNDRGSANYTIAFPEHRTAINLMGNSNRLEGIAEDVIDLLLADRSSPFAFLGYQRWDGDRQNWLRALAEGGTSAGREYWESLGKRRQDEGLDDEDAFRTGADTVAHFGTLLETLRFHDWWRELFPDSPDAVRSQVRLLLESGRNQPAMDLLEMARPAIREQLAWFRKWARAVAYPARVPEELLATYAGEYEVRRFELREGRLYYGRDATSPDGYSELIPLSQDTFVLPTLDFFRLRFEADAEGRIHRVQGLYEDGRTDSNTRAGE